MKLRMKIGTNSIQKQTQTVESYISTWIKGCTPVFFKNSNKRRKQTNDFWKRIRDNAIWAHGIRAPPPNKRVPPYSPSPDHDHTSSVGRSNTPSVSKSHAPSDSPILPSFSPPLTSPTPLPTTTTPHLPTTTPTTTPQKLPTIPTEGNVNGGHLNQQMKLRNVRNCEMSRSLVVRHR